MADEPHQEAEEAPAGPGISVNSIMDTKVKVAVEIGRCRIGMGKLLKLKTGSIVELERLAGEPLDIFVHGTRIAKGEVVAVGNKFGIRLTEIAASINSTIKAAKEEELLNDHR